MPKNSSAIPPIHARRLAALRREMSARKLDGYLIWNRMDQLWLTGFSGEDGGALVTPRSVVLLTDGRFAETAELEAPWAKCILRKVRGPQATADAIRRNRLTRVGFDGDHLSVSAHGAIAKLARPARLVNLPAAIRKLRMIKDDAEIAAIRGAIDIAQRGMHQLLGWLRPGMTERAVAARLVYEMVRMGAQKAAFDPIVASGPGASQPHYEPTDRKIARGEPVLIDWGARAGWYVSDLTRVVWIGSIPPKLKDVFRVVREAHDAAISRMKPGLKASQADRTARNVIRKYGYDKQFTHSLGHGIGLDVHETPGLRKTNHEDVLAPGMVVTVEPGVYLPGVGGVRLESDVRITETGCESLSTLPLELPLVAG